MGGKARSESSEIENYKHTAAKRVNIPTAENQSLVPDDDKAVKLLRYPRNPDLDPQLVWRGKDAEDGEPLEVAAPPVYIQEKIHPRALIENLRRQSAARKKEAAPQVDFFHDFNGLADLEARTEFYAHAQNWQNRMILGDSLLVMGSLAEREALRGKVQCIYFDPPYGIKFNSNWQPSTKSRDVKDGKEDSVSREPEVVRAFRDTWKDGIHSYLSYLRDRLTTAYDLLSETGSIFLQIGDENAHVARALLDETFGSTNFVSQISVSKTAGATSSYLSSIQDYTLWYARNIERLRYRRLFSLKQLGGDGAQKYNRVQLADLQRRVLFEKDIEAVAGGAVDLRPYRQDNLTSQSVGRDKGEGAASWFPVKIAGREIRPSEKVRWKTNQDGMARLLKANRIEVTGNSLAYVRFLDDFAAIELNNLWDDIGGIQSRSDPKVYVVQTPTKVIERCMLMTTDPGDLVLDPTCGSGTSAYVAEQWGRRWITIDTSRVALTLARARLMGAKYDYYHLKDTKDGAAEEAKLTGKPPVDGPFASDIRQGFVYERAPHVTLKSIANNAEIDVIWERHQKTLEPLRDRLNASLKTTWEEWQVPRAADENWPAAAKADHAAWWQVRRERQTGIDASIARNADVEFLYDRPVKARNVVRVAGPFTVESLSPYRVLPLGEDPFLAEALAAERGEADNEPAAPEGNNDFAQVVYENLLASGVQNTKKGEAVKFEWLKPRVSRSGLVPFEGRYLESGE